MPLAFLKHLAHSFDLSLSAHSFPARTLFLFARPFPSSTLTLYLLLVFPCPYRLGSVAGWCRLGLSYLAGVQISYTDPEITRWENPVVAARC